MREVDVAIIGGGPGGLACADVLAMRGRSVTVINEGALMGYGIQGAFTSKAEFEITRQYVYARMRPEVFGEVPRPTFDAVITGMRASADNLGKMLKTRLARTPGITVKEGKAVFVDQHTVKVGEEEIRAEKFVIATGSWPRKLPGIDFSSPRVLTSDTIFDLETLPASLLIVGAGIIGCEFACIFAALGTRVQLLDTQPHILGMEDPDISEFMAKAFEAHGIEVIPSSRFESLDVSADQVVTRLQGGREINTAAALFAVGRVPATEGLNAEAIGLQLDKRGSIPVNDAMQTNLPHIYAVGDVGQRDTPLDIALVHVAQAEGRCAAHHILNETFHSRMDHVPYVVFTIPMLAGAGLSETMARDRHGDGIRIGKFPHSRNHRAHAIAPPIGFTKLIVGPPGDDRILGIRVVGREADTLIAAASVMIERELPYTYLLDCILPHPSLIESLQGAAFIIDGDAIDYEEGEDLGLGQFLAGNKPD